jgi:hypothetical protein
MTEFNLTLELSCNLMNLIRISVTRGVTVGQGASGGRCACVRACSKAALWRHCVDEGSSWSTTIAGSVEELVTA